MIFTGRNGTLRILDGTRQIADAAQGNMSVFLYNATGGTFTDKTAEAYADDTSYTGAMWNEAGDRVYVGFTRRFAMLRALLQTIAGDCGALTVKYYNGSSFVAVTGQSDGTAVGNHSFKQTGNVSWHIPSNWALRGNANLNADEYYVELSWADQTVSAPSADILAPVDGQWFQARFAEMDFSGPLGRPRPEEIAQLDRGQVNAAAHYVMGPDDAIYQPLDVSFSCKLDDTYNRERLKAALQCGNPGTTEWSATGTTTKGTTRNDGTNLNPAFAETAKKTVNVQILWDTGRTASIPDGLAFYEVFFPDEQQSIRESGDGVILSCRGACYGVIEDIHGIANRY